MESRRVRVFHISDLHMRSVDGPQADRARLGAASQWLVLGEKWTNNLAQICGDGIPFDLVVFTGDLGDWGHRTDYPRALAFLKETCAALKVPLDRLFLVPGNHDIDRKVQAAAWKWVRNNIGNDPHAYSEWMAGLGPRELRSNVRRDKILERQQAFWAAVAKDLGRHELEPRHSPHKRLGYRRAVELPGLSQSIHVIGLDTAWLAGDDKDGGALRLTEHQVSLLTTAEGGGPLPGFRLVLMHHRLADLADGADARKWMADRVDLLLHGHQHEPAADVLQGPGHQLLVLATGCLYEGDKGHSYPNACQVIDLALDEHARPRGAEVRFRGWSARGLFWGDDALLYQNACRGRLRLWRGASGWRFDEDAEERRRTAPIGEMTPASKSVPADESTLTSTTPPPQPTDRGGHFTIGDVTERRYTLHHAQIASQAPYDKREDAAIVSSPETSASSERRDLALIFFAGKYEGAEVLLPASGVVRIGRAKGLEVMLVEDSMSRIHAHILISHGVVTISDQGSTNGTFVNGERIERATRLEVGDRILVGTSIMRLATTSGSGSDLKEAREAVESRSSTRGRPISGVLDEILIEDLLQLLSSNRKTGILLVQIGSKSGQIYFAKGKVLGAIVEHSLSGRGAFFEIFTWRAGTYEFFYTDERFGLRGSPIPGAIESTTEELFTEGLKILRQS